MITNINGSAEKFLADLDRIQSTTDRAQRQISSGLKVENPSDAPDQIREIVQLRARIQRQEQIQANLGTAKDQVDAADNGLQSAVSILDRATQLAAQATSSLETPAQRAMIAQDVDGLLQSLVSISRTEVAGRFIFSGDEDLAPAYELNPANPNGVNRLLTAPSTRQVEDARGTSFVFGKTAQDIFDHRNPDDSLAPDNVFAAVRALKVALDNNDVAALANSIDALHQASGYLNTQLTFYGAAQNRIQAALDDAKKIQTEEQARLGDLADADLAAASTELALSNTDQQAALAARAKLPQTSLFNFLA